MEILGRKTLGGGVGVVWMMAAVVMVALLTLEAKRDPVLHRVGGQKPGWTRDVNYTEWAASEPPIYVGDWLYFGFDKHTYTVFEVNKTSYENCIDKDFMTNITKGGRDVFELKNARPYYFLSGGGYCFSGMKVSINVQEFVPVPAPAPAPTSKNGASSSLLLTGKWMMLVLPCLLLTASLV